MLKFDFVQHDEFEDPEYEVSNVDGDYVGYFFYTDTEWVYVGAVNLSNKDELSAKLEEINASTQSQRILGVF